MDLKRKGKRSGKTRDGKIPFYTTLPANLTTLIEREATRRRIPKRQLVETAVQKFFYPDNEKTETEIAIEHILRLEKRNRKLLRRTNLIFEALGLFVEIWCNNTFEVPEEGRDVAAAQGKERFSRYMKELSSRVGKGSGKLRIRL